MLVLVLASSIICRTANTDVRLLKIKSGVCILFKNPHRKEVCSRIWCPKVELKQYDANSVCEDDAQVYRWLQVTHHPKNADVVTVTTARKQPHDF